MIDDVVAVHHVHAPLGDPHHVWRGRHDDAGRRGDDHLSRRRRWVRGLVLGPPRGIRDHGSRDGADGAADDGARARMAGLVSDNRSGAGADGATDERSFFLARERLRAASDDDRQAQHEGDLPRHVTLPERGKVHGECQTQRQARR